MTFLRGPIMLPCHPLCHHVHCCYLCRHHLCRPLHCCRCLPAWCSRGGKDVKRAIEQTLNFGVERWMSRKRLYYLISSRATLPLASHYDSMVQENQKSRGKYWATRLSFSSFARTAQLLACSLTPKCAKKLMINWLFLLCFLLFWTIVHESIWRIKEKTSRAEIRMSSSLFRCVLASLKEGVSVHPSVGPSVCHTFF